MQYGGFVPVSRFRSLCVACCLRCRAPERANRLSERDIFVSEIRPISGNSETLLRCLCDVAGAHRVEQV